MTSLEAVFDELRWFLRGVVTEWLLKDIRQLIAVCITGTHVSMGALATQTANRVSRSRSHARCRFVVLN